MSVSLWVMGHGVYVVHVCVICVRAESVRFVIHGVCVVYVCVINVCVIRVCVSLCDFMSEKNFISVFSSIKSQSETDILIDFISVISSMTTFSSALVSVCVTIHEFCAICVCVISICVIRVCVSLCDFVIHILICARKCRKCVCHNSRVLCHMCLRHQCLCHTCLCVTL